jgi:hypothetical protein
MHSADLGVRRIESVGVVPMRFSLVRSLLSSVLLLFLSLSFSNELNAQTTTSGGLTGVVTDPSNLLVPNANRV